MAKQIDIQESDLVRITNAEAAKLATDLGTDQASVLQAQKQQGIGYNRLNRALTYAIIGLVSTYGALKPITASADPIMSVDYSSSVGNYDGNSSNGLEKKNNYLVKNISPENINDNNLIEFWIPGGSNQGVLYATEDTGDWQVDIFENRTKFTGDSEYIRSGQENTFYTYVSENQQMGSGFAEALARGNTGGQLDFNQVETTVAIPEPAVAGLIAGFGTALLYLRRKFTPHRDL